MIREATISDFEAIQKLEMNVANAHLSARPDIFKNPLQWSVGKEYFEEMLDEEEVKLFVYEKDGKILGHIKLDVEGPDDEEDEEECYSTQHDVLLVFIESIYVDESARGFGIGRELINQAKAYAREIGAVRLELCVWALNQNSKDFYEHLGMSVQSTMMELRIDTVPLLKRD